MKKPTDKFAVNMDTAESDLKMLFQREASFDELPADNEAEHTLSVEEAEQLFDQLRAGIRPSTRPVREANWTHPSVLALGESDPISAIIVRTRDMVLAAIERGWSGPPYNPFQLAEMQGVRLLPTDGILEAQTSSDPGGHFTVEYNPQRPAARMRFSIAHELGHTLFPDCAAETRHRATHQDMKADDWQLESLCNIAAAEILMPFGTLQDELQNRPSVGLFLDLRRKYLVSCEAIANRLIRLTNYPYAAFLLRFDPIRSRYFVEYRISSPALRNKLDIYRGSFLPLSSKVANCNAIGTRDREEARWISGTDPWVVEYLGISPNSGESNPRVLGLACPPLSDDYTASESITLLQGDASEPFGVETKLLLQVVNDQALVWGGGFAKQARKKWPNAQSDFRRWAYDRRNLKLGNIHSVSVRDDLTLVSLICQHGFGASTSGPRLRYRSLFSALEKVADLAKRTNASVHMPRIGTGAAGGSWNLIKGIIREALVSQGLQVTIYDLHSRQEDVALQPSFEFPRDIADEVI
jgi:Zn-dependent peptidase ImmA (M78 family)/O-acetyl-ADP-ribose deacetylase (regulator of RNase III)